jgi:mannose-6-phosphate isomerase-like protein (cupin superfamily)
VSYEVVDLDSLEAIPLEEGVWRPIRRALGVTAFGINAYSAQEIGAPLIEEHDETSPGAGGHEELYFLVRGTATFEIDGDTVEATAGTMILIDPKVRRRATATSADATVVVVGGRPGAAMPPSPFEYWYAAIPAHEAGDHRRAYEIAADGLEHYPDHGTLNYVLACELALVGDRERALERLRTAFANDPRTREWARTESELDSLRDDPLLAGGPTG